MNTHEDYRGMGVTYEGEQTEKSYAAWLRKMYGDIVSRFPPSSVVCFEGDEVHEHVVVSYLFVNDRPSLGIVDMAMRGLEYEDLPKHVRRVCPIHELPKLKYLYNLNGEKLTETFRKQEAVKDSAD